MPTSFEEGKDFTRSIVTALKPKRILDVGAGAGAYAKMFPDVEKVGIEIWEPYVDQYDLRSMYDTVIIADARTLDYGSLGKFDVAIAGDVLEHMTAEEAKDILEKLKRVATTVVVSIPLGYHPQGPYEGNEHETHVVDDWTDEKVRQAFGEPKWCSIGQWIGVYIWSEWRPKICVYTISKNEVGFVKRFAESAREADLVLVADTGSTDGTVEECKKNGVSVYSICITPWRFDHARNAAIALIPREIDICISLDLDEVMEPGWREEIERVWTPDKTRLSYLFDWGAGIRFRYEKIHARHGYFWHHPCHEYPVYDKRITEVWAHTDRLLVSHHPDPTKSRGQYLDLLELSVKEDPNCPRNAFYYARELSFARKWHQSIEECNRYLALPGATWQNERCYAYRVMGICYEEMGDRAAAEGAFQKAAAEAPNTREPWCQLAMLYYRDRRWAECFGASMRALSIKNKELVYTADPSVWGHWPHDLASISAWNLGMKEVAIEQAELAASVSPHEQRLIDNLNFMKRDIATKKRKIPNIIHFIWFVGPKSREFSYLNYLSIKVANEVQKPEKIYLYCNEDLTGNPHWEAAKQYVEMIRIEAPDNMDGAPLYDWPQYQSDVIRLKKLHELGGIYIDTDVFLLKPLNDLMDNQCVMAGFMDGFSEGAKRDVNEYASGQVILAEPRSEFIKIWLEKLPYGLAKNIWAWHCANLPVEIYRERPDLVHMIPAEKFLPFGFNDKNVIEAEHTEKVLSSVKDSYTIHMWETIWSEDLKAITPEYLKTADNAFTRLFRKHA